MNVNRRPHSFAFCPTQTGPEIDRLAAERAAAQAQGRLAYLFGLLDAAKAARR